MDENFAIIMVLVVSIAAAVTLVLSSAWMRRNRPLAYSAQPNEEVRHLAAENEGLREQVYRLEQQLGATDRIAAGDRSARAAT
jgi:hypothetical protein